MHPVYGRVFRRCISVLGGFRFWGVNVSWFVEKGCQHEGCRKRSGLYSWVIQQPAMLMSISTSRPFDTGKGFFRWSHVSLRPWVFFVTSSKKNDMSSCHANVGVSENRGGPPKSSISIGFSIIFTIHFGVPLFLETPMCCSRSELPMTAGSHP